MQIAEIIEENGSQLIKLPNQFHLEGTTVSIRRQGKVLILEPVKPAIWPSAFFDRIFIDDPAFQRLPQGTVPPAPQLD